MKWLRNTDISAVALLLLKLRQVHCETLICVHNQRIYYVLSFLWILPGAGDISVARENCKFFVHTLDQWFPNFFCPPHPWFYIHTHSAPLPFFKKHKCALVSTFIIYLINRLNKIIRVKLNVLCVN
jgi:hypothetical protein